MALTGSGSVKKARMRMSDPQSGQRRGKNLVDAGEEACPAGAGGGAGQGRGGVLVGVYGCLIAGKSGRRFFGLGRVGVVAAEGDNPGPEPCVGGEDAVIAVAVDPGRRDQAREVSRNSRGERARMERPSGVGRAGRSPGGPRPR
jgi:hypothetical protein